MSNAFTTNTQTTTTSTPQVNNADLSGLGVSQVGGNVNLTLTDSGATAAAIANASSVSQAALDLAAQGIGAGVQVANGGLQNAAAAYESGVTLGTDAINAVQAIAANSIATTQDTLGTALAAISANTSQAVSGYGQLASNNTASSGTQIQKVVMYALIAVAAIFILGGGRAFK